MSNLTFQSRSSKLVERWLIRRKSGHTRDGFYTVGKFVRKMVVVRGSEPGQWTREWGAWKLQLNEEMNVDQVEEIYTFMAALDD